MLLLVQGPHFENDCCKKCREPRGERNYQRFMAGKGSLHRERSIWAVCGHVYEKSTVHSQVTEGTIKHLLEAK